MGQSLISSHDAQDRGYARTSGRSSSRCALHLQDAVDRRAIIAAMASCMPGTRIYMYYMYIVYNIHVYNIHVGKAVLSDW